MKIEFANVAAAGAFVLVIAVVVVRLSNGAQPGTLRAKVFGKT